MDVIIFDLDNTLYPASNSLFPLIHERINRFMEERAGIPKALVDVLRRKYWREYGISMVGLMRHHGVNPEDFLEYVHDVDVEGVLRPDRRLAEVLQNLPGIKVVLTNGSQGHARRVLNTLGIQAAFAEIFDVRVAGYRPKPHPEPYQEVLRLLGFPGSRCVMVEDMAVNLKTAKGLGMGTVLVGSAHEEAQAHFVDEWIDEVCALPVAFQHWTNNEHTPE
ncbi:MAG TPA: pyrimidine 5'-nucleotidase [Desulfonatronum sp.]|nr:pyrimidine 5'-nucleotidase [Desulfonatronum sp.]